MREIVALGLLSAKRFPRRITKNDENAINNALGLVDILDIKNKLIGNFSGGQQQRASSRRHSSMNRSYSFSMSRPQPLTRRHGRSFRNPKRSQRTKKVTLIIITHDIGTIGKYASRLLYLDKQVVFAVALMIFVNRTRCQTISASTLNMLYAIGTTNDHRLETRGERPVVRDRIGD